MTKKTTLRYRRSKILYVVMLEVSLIADIVLALSIYEVLKDLLGNLIALAGASFLLASILGATLYLLDRWQIEYLTGNKQ